MKNEKLFSGCAAVALALALNIFAGSAEAITYNYKTIDDPAGSGTYATGINDFGQIVGTFGDSNGPHGFLESGGTFTTLDDPNGGTYVRGVNNLGQVVGTFSDASGVSHGFVESSGVYTTLDDADPSARPGSTNASDINNNGQVVGFFYDTDGHGEIFVERGGKYTTLSPQPSWASVAYGINDFGQVAGYGEAGGIAGSPGDYQSIMVPGAVGYETFAMGINNADQVVGFFEGAGGWHGFLESGGAYTTLSDPLAGRSGTLAYGINDLGQVVGEYWDVNGDAHGFLATPVIDAAVPEPATWAMLILGVGMIGFAARRRCAGMALGFE